MNSLLNKTWFLLLLFIILPPLGLMLIYQNTHWAAKIRAVLAAAASLLYLLLLFSFATSIIHRGMPLPNSAKSTSSDALSTSSALTAESLQTSVEDVLLQYAEAAQYSLDVITLPKDNKLELSVQLTDNRFVSQSECQLTFYRIVGQIYSALQPLTKELERIEINFVQNNTLNYIIVLCNVSDYDRNSYTAHAVVSDLSANPSEPPPAMIEPAAAAQSSSESAVAPPPRKAAPTVASPAAADHSVSGSIALLNITSPIATGQIATVSIKGTPNTEYDIKVKYSSSVSTAKGLENKTSDGSGAISWSWRIGAKTKPGTFSVTIAGGGDSLVIPIVIS